jgi:hypothetical protein
MIEPICKLVWRQCWRSHRSWWPKRRSADNSCWRRIKMMIKIDEAHSCWCWLTVSLAVS